MIEHEKTKYCDYAECSGLIDWVATNMVSWLFHTVSLILIEFILYLPLILIYKGFVWLLA